MDDTASRAMGLIGSMLGLELLSLLVKRKILPASDAIDVIANCNVAFGSQRSIAAPEDRAAFDLARQWLTKAARDYTA